MELPVTPGAGELAVRHGLSEWFGTRVADIVQIGRAAASIEHGIDQRTSWLALGGLGNCHWAELVEGRAGWRIQTWNQSAATASAAGDGLA